MTETFEVMASIRSHRPAEERAINAGVSMNAKQLRIIDATALTLNLTRSYFVQMCIKEWFKNHPDYMKGIE